MSHRKDGSRSRQQSVVRSRLLVASLAVCAVPVAAETPGELSRFSLNLGAFVTHRDTDTRLDSDVLGPGTPIDFEDVLGFDPTNTVARLDGFLRFNPRHRIDFSIFDLSRDAVATIDEEIQFGDEVFDIDTTVTASSDLTVYKVDYTYSAILRERGFLGLTAGLYIMDTGLALSEPTLGRRETRTVTAPLPVLGLRGEYSLAERWTVRGSAEFFALEYNNVDGNLVDLYAGIDYWFTERFALGLAYNKVTIDVTSGHSGLQGVLDWSYQGALLNLRFDFGSVR